MVKGRKLHINLGNLGSCLLLLLCCTLLLPSCKSTRRLAEDEYLLKRNNLVFEDGQSVLTEEIREHIYQRPNRKTLLIWSMHLRLYNSGLGKNQDGKFKTWLRDIGEPPVVYDSSLARKSADQIEKFLFQNGYFNAKVSDSLVLNHKQKKPFITKLFNPLRNHKKVLVSYHINLGKPYFIKSVSYQFADERLKTSFSTLNLAQHPPLVGTMYNYKSLDEHRDIISTHFRNDGYFDFEKDYVKFRADTMPGDHKVRLTVKILNPVIRDLKGESQSQIHTRYTVNQIYVYPNYDLFKSNRFSDTLKRKDIQVIYNPPSRINPKLLANKVFIKKYYYQSKLVTGTYRSLNDMGIFKSVNIDFEYLNSDQNLESELLNAHIYLNPLKRHSFSVETRVETRAYSGQRDDDQGVTNLNLGFSANVSFSRINAFKNGETLKLSLTGGLEPLFLSDSSAAKNFFNTVEFGPSVQLTLPRFLLPFNTSGISKYSRPQTIMSATYNLLKNEDFFRRAIKISYAYSWLETQEKLHKFSPLELSFINARLSAPLQARLDALGNPFLNATYSDQIIIASSYSFTFRRNEKKPETNGWYYRGKIEGAGNTARFLSSLNNPEHNANSQYELFGIQFAQYVAVDNDFRYYRYNRFNQTLATRLFVGVTKPLENVEALPFEKSYFAGGSNGIRAWRARTLGPGSYLDTTSFSGFLNRVGEIKLEGNIEYRFKLISLLEAAVFMDAGNIWVFEEKAGRTGTQFDREFYRDIAIGAGFGLRLDFDFFIIRFDLGYPVRDPSLPENEKWFFQDKETYNQYVARFNSRNGLLGDDAVSRYRRQPNFNIGIGYPF